MVLRVVGILLESCVVRRPILILSGSVGTRQSHCRQVVFEFSLKPP